MAWPRRSTTKRTASTARPAAIRVAPTGRVMSYIEWVGGWVGG